MKMILSARSGLAITLADFRRSATALPTVGFAVGVPLDLRRYFCNRSDQDFYAEGAVWMSSPPHRFSVAPMMDGIKY